MNIKINKYQQGFRLYVDGIIAYEVSKLSNLDKEVITTFRGEELRIQRSGLFTRSLFFISPPFFIFLDGQLIAAGYSTPKELKDYVENKCYWLYYSSLLQNISLISFFFLLIFERILPEIIQGFLILIAILGFIITFIGVLLSSAMLSPVLPFGLLSIPFSIFLYFCRRSLERGQHTITYLKVLGTVQLIDFLLFSCWGVVILFSIIDTPGTILFLPFSLLFYWFHYREYKRIATTIHSLSLPNNLTWKKSISKASSEDILDDLWLNGE